MLSEVTNTKEISQTEGVFTTTRLRSSGFIESALFWFTRELMHRQDPLVNPYKTKIMTRSEAPAPQTSPRQAILIELPIDIKDKTVSLLFTDYHCTTQHLTVDEFYHTDEASHALLSSAHYTAEYRHENNPSQKRVVHVYFNREGQLQNISFKEVNLSTGVSDLLPVDSNITNQIKQNAASSQKLLQDLLFEKSKKYEVAQQNADKAEKALEAAVTKAIQSKDVTVEREKLIGLIKGFQEAVQKVNQLCDTRVDTRVVSKKHLLDFIERNTSMEQSNVPIKNEECPEENIQDRANVKTCKKKNFKKSTVSNIEITSEINELKRLVNELGRRIESLKDPSEEDVKLQNLIAIHQLMLEIQYQETALLFHVKFDTVKKEVDRLEGQISQKMISMPSVDDLCNDLFLKGDVESFKRLFDALENQLKTEFYSKLLKKLEDIVFNKQKTAKNQIKILDFLFEKSALYRSSLVSFSQRKYGCVLEGKNFFVLPLARCVVQDKFDFFEMLLRQGHRLNVALIHEKHESLSLIQIIIRFARSIVQPQLFLEKALEYGAVVDEVQVLMSMPSVLTKHDKNLSQERNTLIEEKKMSLMKNLEKADIVKAIESAAFSLIPVLAPLATLEDLSLALARLSLDPSLNIAFTPRSMMSGIFFISNENERAFVRNQINSSKALHAATKRVAYRMSFTDDAAPLTLAQKDDLVTAIKSLSLELQNRLQRTSVAKIHQVLKNCQNFAKQDTLSTLKYTRAATFILTHKNQLSVADQTNLFILFYTLGVAYQKLNRPGCEDEARGLYENALSVVEYGIPQNELVVALSAFGPKKTNYIEITHQKLASLGSLYQPMMKAAEPAVTPAFNHASQTSSWEDRNNILTCK